MRAKTLLAIAFLASVILLLPVSGQAQAPPGTTISQMTRHSGPFSPLLCPDGSVRHPIHGCPKKLDPFFTTPSCSRFVHNPFLNCFTFNNDDFSFIDGAGCWCSAGGCSCHPESLGGQRRKRGCPWREEAEQRLARRQRDGDLVSAVIVDPPPRREPREPSPKSGWGWDGGRGRGSGFGVASTGGHHGWSGGDSGYGSATTGGHHGNSGGGFSHGSTGGHHGGGGSSSDHGSSSGSHGGGDGQSGRPR